MYEIPGPFATACLDATRSEESAAHEIELRWRHHREQLADAGAPDPLLEEMQAAALAVDGYPGPHGRMIVGAGKEVLIDAVLPHPPQRESAAWAALPHLLPYVRQYAWSVPHVLALVDRVGADITAYGSLSEERDQREVDGDTLHVSKVKVGGWSHKKYQQRSENLWHQNAHEVAAAVNELVAEVGAKVLAVAGDTRAREALERHLSERSRSVLVVLEHGGRASGVDDEPLREELLTKVRLRAMEEMSEVVRRFEEQRGRHEAAAEGIAAVVETLRRAQVDTLLLRDDPSATTQLWVGPDPLHLALDAADLTGLGVDEPVQDRADAAIVRALAGTGGRLVLAPAGGFELRDGIGALLRYADDATPSA